MSHQVVRVRRPKAVLFYFCGTISPVDWEKRCIFPYVQRWMLSFLKSKWPLDQDTRSLIDKLRESSDEHRASRESPLKSLKWMLVPSIITFDSSNSNWLAVLKSVNDYVLWDLAKTKSSPSAISLAKMCWMQGYREQAIKTLLFKDVLPAIKRFRSMDIKTCVYTTTMSQEITRLVLSSTTDGNVAQYVDYFFDEENVGFPRVSSSYDKIAAILNVAKSDILFICEDGQDLRISVDSGLQGVLILRDLWLWLSIDKPANREDDLIRFAHISNLEQIQFVDPTSTAVTPVGSPPPKDPGPA